MKVEFTTGNFELVIEGELNADAQAKFLQSGLTYIVQRDGASKAYLELAGVENDKGKKQLPKDFERKTVDWSETTNSTMTAAFEKALAPYGTFVVSGSEHVAGADVSPMKRATEFVDALMTNAENEAQLRGILGLVSKSDVTNASRDELIALANEHGFGKAKPKA